MWAYLRRSFLRVRRVKRIGLALLGVVVSFVYFNFFAPPADFPLHATVRIEEGMTLTDIAHLLEEAQIIRSRTAFASLLTITGRDDQVVAGQYKFERPYSLFTVIQRLARGTFGFHMVRLVFPEGATAREIALIADRRLPLFDRERFLAAVADKEGYLFPDTYFFTPVATDEDVLMELERNFKKQVGPFEVQALLRGHTLHEILTMASLIEEEAKETEERRLIAGILWNRIEADMPLQVDAVFPYIVGRNTFQVTKADLNHESLYNTYRYKGLPPGPISNPGLSSIEAALYPTKSNNLFYLHGRDGTMHYASTFEEHVANRRKFLD